MHSLTSTTLALAAIFFTSPGVAPGASANAATAAPTSETKDAPQNPPGLVLVEGGRTKIGTSMKDMKKFIEEHNEAQEKAAGFLGETPQHTVSVDDCYMMVTETTHEQFHEYVKATGAMPPYLWGDGAIQAAIKAQQDEYGAKVREARANNTQMPERPEPIDKAYWWEQNWKKSEWEMPEAIAKKPVVFVDYQDARGYAEWAGLRLMTEFEFERAVRGNSDRDWAWGEDWKENACATTELRKVSDCVDVGSFPEGASPEGIRDLNGNVWEWTSSRYDAYPKFKHERFTVGKGALKKEIDSMPKFSADRRVVRSGAQQVSKLFARASTRGGFDRYQKASVLGFRCAASVKPGVDFARDRMKNIPNEIRPQDSKGPVIFLPEAVTAMDRWHSTDGASETPGYAVITGYDYILFTPTEQIQTNGVNDIRKGSLKDEITFVGFLSTNQDMVEPALRAGTYLVAIRGAGKYPDREAPQDAEGEGDEAAPVEAGSKDDDGDGPTTLRVDEHLEIDPEVDNYIFIDMEGTPVAAMATPELEYGNVTSATKLGAFVVEKTVTLEIPGQEEGEVEEIEVQQQWLDLKYFVKGRSRKGLKGTLALRFDEGLLDGEWRR